MPLSPELISEIRSATDTQAAIALASLTTHMPAQLRNFPPARALAMLTVDETYLRHVDDTFRTYIEAFRSRLTNNTIARALNPEPADADAQVLTRQNGPGRLFNPQIRPGEDVQAPTALWAKGDTRLLAKPKSELITITGARAATAYGEHVAADITEGVTAQSKTVVTSFAYGINEAAIRASLAAGHPPIVYLASGINKTYPTGLSSLPELVLDAGGLILSATPPDALPNRARFIATNHHLALTSGTSIVVEGGVRGGARAVAEAASATGHHVGAVPGPVTSVASALPNQLLVNGTAQAVTNATDTLNLASQPRPGVQRQVETHTTVLRLADPTPQPSMT